jgi:hypothetical protein
MNRRCALLLIALASAPVSAQVDPFYVARQRDGEAALARGDARAAAKDLRIGCFGMLREPAALGRCLATLALAEVRAGDLEAASRTFERLVEAEVLVQAWTLAVLPVELRRAFVQEVGSRLADSQLADRPAFAELLAAKQSAALAGLAGNALRRELEARIAADPTVVAWHEQLAAFYEREAKPGDALTAVDAARQAGHRTERLVCLAGAAAARLGRWERAAAELEHCTEPASAVLRVEALVALERLDEARELWRNLSAEQRATAPKLEPKLGAAAPPPSAPPPGSAGNGDLAALRNALGRARDAETVRGILDQAEAHARAGASAAWHIAAEAAYRLSLWELAVAHYQQGGAPTAADQQFYNAVALWESGQAEAARQMLARSLTQLKRTEYVERMIEVIQGEAGP